MLKVKDVSKLADFGFKCLDDPFTEGTKMFGKHVSADGTNADYLILVDGSRRLKVVPETSLRFVDESSDVPLDTLYELFTANLVERVADDN